jgi:protein disulfide-isomerase A1
MLKLAVLALVALAVTAEYTKEDDVLVLTDENIGDAIKEFPFLLVEFYAPWCGHCKSLAPEYAKAATTLAGLDEPIPIAKVDATENSKCAGEYGVRGYPTLKWFVNGEATEYTGGRTADTIVSWIKKKTGPPCKPLADKDAIDQFKDGADVVVVAFADTESDDFKTIESAARGIEDIEFGVAGSDAASAAGASFPSIVLFKKFDEGEATYEGEMVVDDIKSFVQGNSVPLISTFSQENAPKIFGSGIDTHFLYFNDESAEGHEDTLAELKKVATDFKGKTLFVFVPHTEERVMGFFDLTKDDVPAAVLIQMGEGDMKKFGFAKDITADNVRGHVEAYFAGDLKPTLKSEPVPEDNSGPVTVIVGENFNDIVLDSNKDVLLEFYAPWCGHCKSLAPTYEELGEKFAGNDNIVIAKIDATANDVDHPKVNVKGFPTILFFSADNKDAPATYEGGRDLDSMVEYIQKNAKNASAGDDDAKAKDEL